MSTVTTSSKGQIVIPKSIREALHIREGTRLRIEALTDESAVLHVLRADVQSQVSAAAGMLARYRKRPTSSKSDDAELERAVRKDDARTKRRKTTRKP